MRRAGIYSEIWAGITHFLVDLTCTAMLSRISTQLPPASLIACAVLYNCLAFAFQLPIGAFADLLHSTRVTAALGCLLIAMGVFFSTPLVMCVFLGFGNACFHVGAGRESLKIGGAGAVGRFVAPGALGIFLGPRLTRFSVPIFSAALLLLGTASFLYRHKASAKKASSLRGLPSILIAGCMFFTVLLRSYIGTVLRFPQLSQLCWALTFSLFVFAGKFIGGMLADRYGMLRSSFYTQLAASALLTLSVAYPVFAFPGILLFNTTMAVTAAYLYQIAPHFPGTMFGLTTAALFLGVLPRLLGWKNPLFCVWGIGILCLLSTVFLLAGLILGERRHGHAGFTGIVAGADPVS